MIDLTFKPEEINLVDAYHVIIELTNDQAYQADNYLEKNVGPCGDDWGSGVLTDDTREQLEASNRAVRVSFRTTKHLRMFALWCNFNSVDILWTSNNCVLVS